MAHTGEHGGALFHVTFNAFAHSDKSAASASYLCCASRTKARSVTPAPEGLCGGGKAQD